jgi:hypothetical protein
MRSPQNTATASESLHVPVGAAAATTEPAPTRALRVRVVGATQRQGAGDVTQLEPRQRRSEEDIHVAAAARRDVGSVPGTEAAEQLAEPGGLVPDIATARVKVKRQHPPGSRAGIIDRDRARLPRRLGGQRPGMTGRVSTAAIARDPDMRSTGDRRCDRMPSGLCGGAREAVRTARVRCSYTRRVALGQC